MIPLLLNVDWKRVSVGVLVVVVLAMAAAVRIEHYRAEQTDRVYANPKTIVRVVRVAGPVRVKTVIVERPGEKTTTVEEARGAVIETTENVSEPVPISITMAQPGNAWLAGIGNRNADVKSWRAYSLWAGRELGTRAQVQIGVGYRDSVEAQGVFMLKFGR